MVGGPGEGTLRYRLWLEGLLGVPATDGNRVDVLRNGDQIFPAMLDAIGSATRSVDISTFNFGGSMAAEFADALAERAGAGVRVRVLIDALGAGRGSKAAVERMRRAGAQVELFRPLLNPRVWESFHRAHRKLLVCDQEVALTGGVGIADEWRGDATGPSEWRDTHFRIRGPAVDGLMGSFVHNWAETERPLFDEGVDAFADRQPAGEAPVQVVRAGARTGWGDMSTLVWCLLRLARRRVRIASAYFAPHADMLSLLCATAERGVQVEVLMNGPHADKALSRLASEAQFETLLEAGVQVWSFQPTMLHLKAITVDGQVASVGSANFNARSFQLDEEVNVVLFDAGLVDLLDAHFDEDVARSHPVDPAEWTARGPGRKALEAAPGFLARHL